MSYRVRFTTQTGATFYWERTFATRTGATHSAQLQSDSTGYMFAVEEVPDAPEPTSTTERLVGLLPDAPQWKEEAPRWTRDVPRETIMKIDDESMRAFAAGPGGFAKVTKEATAAPEPGSTAAHHVEILRERVKELEEELARAKPSLTKAPSVPVGASEAPGEGGDSDRRRLEALERYLEGDPLREVWKTFIGPFAAGTKFEGQHFDAPTLAALADKLAEMEAKP